MVREILHKSSKAAKDHTCDFCNGAIKKGTRYEISVMVFEGDIYRWKSHRHCNALINVLEIQDYDGNGIESSDFVECVCCEYQNIVSKYNPERWQHELHHGTPNFKERLKFVLEHYKIKEDGS